MLFKKGVLVVFGVLGLLGAFGNCPVFGADWKVLPGHVPPGLSRLTANGRVAATNQLRLAIGLPLHDVAGLQTFLAQVYDPTSPNFHQFLTPEEFTARFGPTEQDYATVKNFAKTNGLAVTTTYGNRLVLDVAGPARAVEQAFHLTLRTYRHPTEARDFFAPDTEPTVDAHLPVVDIQGLSDFWRPHPRLHRLDAATAASARPKNGSSPDNQGDYFGNDFRNAYVPGTVLTGAGQMVGLFEFDGYYANDIAAYAKAAGNGRTNIVMQTVLLDGFSGTPTTGADSGNGEVSLDIEMAMDMAPGLAKIVVFEGNPSSYLQNSVLDAMVASNLVKNLSCSWGWNGGPSTTTDSIFTNMAALGQSFFNASGDTCAFTAGSSSVNGVDNPSLYNEPSGTPFITQVGGTTLTTGANAAYTTETVWNWNIEFPGQGYDGVGSSGGVSSFYTIPNWQTSVSNLAGRGGSTSFRNIPDVAMTADNIYVISGGHGAGSDGNGGTSCAAPLWAGFLALVNQQAAANGNASGVGLVNSALYAAAGSSYSTCFHDVTTGNNTWSSSPDLFDAMTGYDLCTGLGTPATSLINALAGAADSLVISPLSGAATGVAGGPFSVTSGNILLTNTSSSVLTWSLVSTSPWLNFSATSGSLAANATTTLTASLTAAANNLAVGTYDANLVFSNGVSHVTQPGLFALQVNQPMAVSPNNGFATAGPVGGPFVVTSQNFTLTNQGVSSLAWSLVNTSSWLNVSVTGGNLAGGAQTGVTVSLAAAANSLAAGSYTANVLVTNLTGVAASLAFTINAGQPIVLNGGFETGDFTDWTLNADSTLTIVSSNAGLVHSGSYGAALGQTSANPLGYLSQTLVTTPGQSYLLSLWLDNPTNSYGATPNQFLVQWNGTALFNVTNLPYTAWTNLQFVVTATSTATVLQFGFFDQPYYLGLDDISVTPVAPPVISTQPTNLTLLAGGTAVFSATAGGATPLVYQWKENGANVANGSGISGATSNVLTLTAVTTNSSGNYSLVVTNVFGSITSSVAILNVATAPAITTQPTNLTLVSGSTAVFSVTASGSAPLVYQWQENGTNLSSGAGISGVTSNVLALAAVTTNNSGNYSLVVTNFYGSITSSVASLAIASVPVITAQPTNLTLLAGGTAVFSATASGSGSLAYHWKINGTNVTNGTGISGATSNVLTLTAVTTNSSGNYSLAVTNVYGSITSSVAFLNVGFAPAISTQPTNLTTLSGSNAVFSATATGSAPLVYQWLENGTNLANGAGISGATTNLLALAAVTTNSGGNYSLVVTNVFGSITSSVAILTIAAAPVITTQPTNLTLLAGSTAIFSATAGGSAPLFYHWKKNSGNVANGANISGATSNVLTLTDIITNMSGNYSLVVTNFYGSITSSVAVLNVATAPVFKAAQAGGTAFNLTWSAVTGQVYQVQYTTNLIPPNWINLLAKPLVATNGTMTVSDTNGVLSWPGRFYRLVVE
jgi:subtilase family serine protease